MEERKISASGYLCGHNVHEGHNALFIHSIEEPVADWLYPIYRKQVTVRYWITDKEATKEEAAEAFVESLSGKADGRFDPAYSELTGYLWTNEELKVGSHDLIERLRSHVGKWVNIEIEIHSKADN